jgi:HEAT repeat protein
MIDESSAPDSLAVAAHRAITRAVSGAKRDADSAGRLLMAIPADTADAVLLEVETVLMTDDPRFWLALEGARDWLCWDKPRGSLHQPTSADSALALSVKALFADGRVRERAVRLLAESRSLAALPVLGLRAADWVPQVREAARDAILRRLDDDIDAAALAVIAPMALFLAQRQQGRWLADQITRRLADVSSSPVVTRLLTSTNLQLRRAAYQVLADAGTLGLERAVQAALHDRDVIIRSRCAERAARLALDAGSAPLIRQMLASHTPRVRVEALAALNRLGEFDTIQAALPDRSSLVRGTARFYLRPHGVDFPEIYHRFLDSDTDAVILGSVAGLGEVGTAADTDVIEPLLSHPRVKIRVEAICALETLAPAIDVEQMLTLIEEDPSPAVTRQAAAVILARGSSVDAERLLALLEPGRPVPVRLAARRLLAARDSAWRLAVNVMLLADPEDVVARQARSDLGAAMQQ